MGLALTADRICQALDDVAEIHPQIVEEFEVGVSKMWHDDEFAGGAFALFDPGQQTLLHAHIIKPEGRIHFAGEHASLAHAWIQGAIESGLRAAHEIHQAGSFTASAGYTAAQRWRCRRRPAIRYGVFGKSCFRPNTPLRSPERRYSLTQLRLQNTPASSTCTCALSPSLIGLDVLPLDLPHVCTTCPSETVHRMFCSAFCTPAGIRYQVSGCQVSAVELSLFAVLGVALCIRATESLAAGLAVSEDSGQLDSLVPACT